MRYMISILVLCISCCARGQTLPANFNLIPNGGLEFLDGYANIPYSSTYLANNSCWISATLRPTLPFSASWYKRQVDLGNPRTGRNALWMLSEMPWFADTSKESNGEVYYSTSYPETKLLEPLIAGVTYFFTMYVGVLNPLNRSKWDTTSLRSNIYVVTNLGVYFSDTVYHLPISNGRLKPKPQIEFVDWDLPYDDSFVYIKLSAKYLANGGEQFMTIGNFAHYKDFTFIGKRVPLGTDSTTLHLYYPFIDDISLVRDTSQAMISLDHFSLGRDTSICPGESLQIGGDPHFFAYLWNTGDTSRVLTIDKPGTYWCKADFGCSSVTDTIVVSGSESLPDFDIADTAICESGLPLTVEAPYRGASYLWSNGSLDFSTLFHSTGKQWLRISNACGDSQVSDTFEIVSLNKALDKIDLGADTNNCLYGYFSDTITLKVSAGPGDWIKWSSGSNSKQIRVQDTGTYWVQVSNACYSVSDTIRISGCSSGIIPKVDIPNAFSPNGDGKNDVFRLKYLPQQILRFQFQIFNRYGQMITELRNRNDFWDGGNYDIGVYYYLFTYEDSSGRQYTQKGDISLIR